jgi:hypothetical protein
MNLYQINTTAYPEEDMLLVTDAPDDAIERILGFMVYEERKEKAWYDHDDYLNALKTAQPQFTFFYYVEPHLIVL